MCIRDSLLAVRADGVGEVDEAGARFELLVPGDGLGGGHGVIRDEAGSALQGQCASCGELANFQSELLELGGFRNEAREVGGWRVVLRRVLVRDDERVDAAVEAEGLL